MDVYTILPRSNSPFYIFYDCEATGRNPKEDRVIEIGAVVCTQNLEPGAARALQQNNRHEFTSLCYCTHTIDPKEAEILTLTLADLKDAPKPKDVLISFCEWIEKVVRMAEQRSSAKYSPVLVAHSGNRLDYPLLFKEIERAHSPTLTRKFTGLDLHYTDTHSAIRQVARTDKFYRDLPGLGIKDLHQAFFHKPYEGHRALPDAEALYNIFTKCESSKQGVLFSEILKFIQTKEGVELTNEQIPKFLAARIKPAKAEELLMKGITYDRVLQEFKRSPDNFKHYLRVRCGITRPKQELLDHFESKLSDTDDSNSD